MAQMKQIGAESKLLFSDMRRAWNLKREVKRTQRVMTHAELVFVRKTFWKGCETLPFAVLFWVPIVGWGVVAIIVLLPTVLPALFWSDRIRVRRE
jgi:hypothetical protein